MRNFILSVPLVRRYFDTDRSQQNLKSALDTLPEVGLLYAGFLVIFALLFCLAEGIGFHDALYWAGITGPTVGYGDLTPKTGLGKVLSVIWAHIGLIVAALFTTRLLMKVIDDRNEFTHEEQEDQKRCNEETRAQLVEVLNELSRVRAEIQELRDGR